MRLCNESKPCIPSWPLFPYIHWVGCWSKFCAHMDGDYNSQYWSGNIWYFDNCIVRIQEIWKLNSLQKSFASISFRYGRKPVGIIGYIFFLLFGIVSSFSPNYTAFLVLRFLAAMFKTWKEVGGGIAGSVAFIWDDNHYILSGWIVRSAKCFKQFRTNFGGVQRIYQIFKVECFSAVFSNLVFYNVGHKEYMYPLYFQHWKLLVNHEE